MTTKFFYHIFKDNLHLPHEVSIYLNLASNLLIILAFGYALFRILRFLGRKYLSKIAYKTKTSFDDLLIKNRVFLNVARIVMLLLFNSSLHILLEEFPITYKYLDRVVSVVITFFIIWFIRSILLTIKDFLRELPSFKDKPLESYVQIFMVILWMIGVIIAFSLLTNKSLYKFLTALGTFSAILLLIFKDTILGFVASIQITVNDTVRLNDWITMEKYSADGNVIEINLASVIVKNFDNTITSIPTYSLISDSFKNWRAMSNSGGRRIKRSILIKANSIKFIDDIKSFERIELLKSYIENITQEISEYNKTNKVDKSVLINGRNLTNFGLFRKYLDEYLKQHPQINQELLFMTRQLAPTPNGIPLEIYAFSTNKVWANYERIMADIFDHIFASVPYFDLEIFELPTGKDFRNH
ncbi:mechanosensitive ion channel family protein [Tenacibaculum xiamenense]|uniref:mechanosensitive ion channel family protein n=1 Tax=Tenacibaculum xiamenense TaxID=1261553 RepID=UPI003894694F